MISKILVPTDGSRVAQKAAHYAVELAKQTGGSLIVLSVIDRRFIEVQSVPPVISPTHLIEPIEDFLKQAAKSYTEDIEKLCQKNNVRSKTVIRSGHPVEEILKEADKSKADLIVMGSHGKSAIKAAILGSVTSGVIHKGKKIPVLLVRK